MVKRYNIVTRCLALVALFFEYVVGTSAILVGATTSSAQAWVVRLSSESPELRVEGGFGRLPLHTQILRYQKANMLHSGGVDYKLLL